MGCGQSKLEGKYDDYDWKELPPEVQEAAKTLGYTKKIWDNEGKVRIQQEVNHIFVFIAYGTFFI